MKPTYKPGLNREQSDDRLEFAHRHEHWGLEEWKNIICLMKSQLSSVIDAEPLSYGDLSWRRMKLPSCGGGGRGSQSSCLGAKEQRGLEYMLYKTDIIVYGVGPFYRDLIQATSPNSKTRPQMHYPGFVSFYTGCHQEFRLVFCQY